jgi:uncharacterized protein (TIGR02246 family)
MLSLTLGLLLSGTAASAPILVSVDDLPMARRFHQAPAEREAITRGLLAVLAKHGIKAVGLATGANHATPADVALLELWLAAGHELGNHSFGHLDYSRTDADTYVADVDKQRAFLDGFLGQRGRTLRFFRFPFLREGDTPAKLEAMRAWLARTGQRDLPVTVDNQDWSYEEPWLAAKRAGDAAALRRLAEDYQAALRLHVRHFEAMSERLFGRPVPQILLLHPGQASVELWDGLFDWLTASGHRFATADEVLADPAYQVAHAYVGRYGLSLWDRIRVERRRQEVSEAVKRVVAEQVAAWNRGDLPGFVSYYAPDCTYVSPSGLRKGTADLLGQYQRRYPTRAAMGTLAIEVEELRTIEGQDSSLFGDAVPSDVHGVSLVGRWTLSYPDKSPTSGRTVLVLQRRGDAWEIREDVSF